jgi:hypothetical protein
MRTYERPTLTAAGSFEKLTSLAARGGVRRWSGTNTLSVRGSAPECPISRLRARAAQR